MPTEYILISALTDKEAAFLEGGREFIRQFLQDDEARESFETVDGKLGTIHQMVEAGVLQPKHTQALTSLGIVLGDAFAQLLRSEWVERRWNSSRDGSREEEQPRVSRQHVPDADPEPEAADVVELFYPLVARINELD